MLVTCVSCRAGDSYLVKDYLNYLANTTGIGNSEKFEDNFNNLLDWQIVIDSDKAFINDELNYAFLSKTICNLLEEQGNPIDILVNKGLISSNNANKKVNKQVAIDVVDKAIGIINNKSFKKEYEYKYNENVKDSDDQLNINDIYFDNETKTYRKIIDEDGDISSIEADFNEVYSYLDIADTYEIDFSEAEVIPLQEEEKSNYINNKFNLLASKNHVFNKDGYRISYTINSSGISVHVSKEVDKSTVYADASINSVKPSFKWTYDKGDLKNCYFSLKMNSTSTLGATIGKYGNYYLKLKDLDSSSFMSAIKSMVVNKKDELEATIPICQIKTPIADIPNVYLNMTVGIKLYASGTIELVLYNSHNIGFEVRNGNARFFYTHDDDFDTFIKASGKVALALNLGLDASKFRLCDIEFDGGVKAELKPTLHLYDSDFNQSEASSDIAYSTLLDLTKDNPYVKLCGDVSLYWLADLICNTSKSILYKMGFTKTFNITNENDQVFGNLHHIENGQFVKKCTRKNKTTIKNEKLDITTANKIVLNSYAEVMLVNETFKIELLSLPEGYSEENVIYTSSDNNVAKVENGMIIALKPGSSKINVHTSDGKYNTYINVLVSTG